MFVLRSARLLYACCAGGTGIWQDTTGSKLSRLQPVLKHRKSQTEPARDVARTGKIAQMPTSCESTQLSESGIFAGLTLKRVTALARSLLNPFGARKYGYFLTLVLAFTTACSDGNKSEYLAKGNEYFERKQYSEALSMYRKAIEIDRKAGDSYYRAGITAMKLELWDEAVRSLESAVVLSPENMDAHSKLADVYLFAYGAAPHLRKAISLELLSLSARLQERFPTSYDNARLLGYVASFNNDKIGAIRQFAIANRMRPDDPELARAYAEALFADNQAEVGEEVALKALASRTDVAALYDLLFQHYVKVNKPPEAESILERKVANLPKSVDGHLQMAAWYFSTGRPDEMQQVLERINSDRKSFPLAPLLVGDFYLRVNMLPLAADHYQQAIRLGGVVGRQAQKRSVDVLVKQKKMAEAEQVVRALRAAEPQDPEAIALEASLKLTKQSEEANRAAVASFQSVLPKMTTDFVLRYQYAQALLRSGDAGGAATQCDEALRLRPDYFAPRVLLAEIALREDRIKDVHILMNSLSRDPGINVPFDTAGQRPQEQPLYESILGIKSSAGDSIARITAGLSDKRRRLSQTVGAQARPWIVPK